MKNKDIAVKMLKDLEERLDWQEVDEIRNIIEFINKNL
jgi:hypothetical protein